MRVIPTTLLLLLAACAPSGPGADTETGASPPGESAAPDSDEASHEICWNDDDDDGDGLIDDDDPDCDATRPEDETLDVDRDGWPEDTTDNTDEDCDDNDRRVHPGATEICNGVDDDCDDQIDETDGTTTLDGQEVPYAPGCTWTWPDRDGDGYGTAELRRDGRTPACTCAPPEPVEGVTWVADDTDCDDDDEDHHPGAEPLCDGSTDDDCDGLDDDEAVPLEVACETLEDSFCADGGCEDWYLDWDSDGYGDAASTRCLCTDEITDELDALLGRVDDDRDCDDHDADWHFIILYYDRDGDGYGDDELDGEPMCGPGLPAPTTRLGMESYTAPNAGDCDDGDKEINPGAEEVCDSSDVDEDCSGEADEEQSTYCEDYYDDDDGDGFGDTTSLRCLCDPLTGPAPPEEDGDDEYNYTTQDPDDCDDTDADVFPGNDETECNDTDDDCDDSTLDDPDGTCATDTGA